MKISFSDLLSDIRFWIILFFIIRLYAITNPPLEVGHNWRQTDGMMIARNFYERGADIFYPTVDVGGDLTGIVGSEFPLLNYLVYLISKVFGYDHWYGRIVVLLFSSLGTFYFFKLVRKFFGERVGFSATIIFLVSLWFSYSRKNIPDAMALSLCLMSLYFALQYLEHGNVFKLILFFVCGALGCLSKISAATILTVLALPMLDKRYDVWNKTMLSFFSVAILALVWGWYFYWVPYLNETYGLGDHFFMGMPFGEGIQSIIEKWQLVLKRFYDTPLKYTGFAAFLAGLFLVIWKKQWLALVVFLLPFCSFLVILVKTGSSIIGDTYYVLTIIPSMAFIAGYGVAQIKDKRIAAFALLVIGVEGIASQIYDFRIRQPFRALETLETVMDQVSKRDDLIVVNSQVQEPTTMYFAHRRGWTALNGSLSEQTYLDYVRGKGCKFVLIGRKLYGDLDLDLPVVHESEYFKVYKLQ